jgi:hypothetical protein
MRGIEKITLSIKSPHPSSKLATFSAGEKAFVSAKFHLSNKTEFYK